MSLYVKTILAQSLSQMEDIRNKNEEKVEEARKLYWDACKYPRKKKKSMRKQALKDFNFWAGVADYYNEMFPKI